ncbi:MAG: hypothetical protein D6781_00095 [Verrucomicrobia bacterium]|nr:MAG: hypothetical protein D6781_00095 [Verrucomicrobiota bacterium]
MPCRARRRKPKHLPETGQKQPHLPGGEQDLLVLDPDARLASDHRHKLIVRLNPRPVGTAGVIGDIAEHDVLRGNDSEHSG